MIYICIPAHNEEQTVGVVLWKIRQVMADFPRDYQLLVVDDASTDKTAAVLAPYARVLPLTVVRSDTRKGEGAATEMMLREAVRRSQYPKRDVIITLQADFTQEPDELIGVIKRMEAGADVVVAQTPIDPKAPWRVRWARNVALRVLGRKRIPQGVADPFTSYRGYRVFTVRRALEERPGRLVHWSGWAGAAELLLAMTPHARRIDTVDMTERRERLQRTSRLEPWAALKDVWALAREAKPLQVASPAELDQAMQAIAAVRTSEVTAARQGVRTEARTQREGGRRGSSEERGRSERSRRDSSGRPRNGDSRPERERSPRAERPERTPEEARARREERRPKREEGQRPPRAERPPRPPRERPAPERVPEEVEAQLPLDPLLEVLGADVALPGEPAKRKRKRPRRRKKSGAGAEGATSLNGELPIEGLEPALVSGAAESDEGGADAEEGGETADGAPRARRRRRGRRGGRRRNGAAAAGGEAGEAGEGDAMDAAPQNEAAGADSVPVFNEGERTSDA